MRTLHPELGLKGIVFALILELVFLGSCVVFVGLGLSEMKRRGQPAKNIPLVLLGLCLAVLSLYVTRLLMEG